MISSCRCMQEKKAGSEAKHSPNLQENMDYKIKQFETELKIRGFSKRTVESYVCDLQKYFKFNTQNPKLTTVQDIKDYMAYMMVDKNLSPASVSKALSSMRFYFEELFDMDLFRRIKYPKQEKKIPRALLKEEVQALIDNTKNPKHRLLLKLLYSSGLRVGECVKLKFQDIDIEQGVGTLRQGKGNKDRNIIISKTIKEDLAKIGETGYIFTYRGKPISVRQVQYVLKYVAKKAGIKKRVHPHLLRSSFATHLLDAGTNIRIIQELLGHSSIMSTERYTKVSYEQIKKVTNPLDCLTIT